MRRVWKNSNARYFRKPLIATAAPAKIIPLPNPSKGTTLLLTRGFSENSPGSILAIFADKFSYVDSEAKQHLRAQVSVLKDELVKTGEYDDVQIEKVLDEKGVPLFRNYSDGSAVVELLIQLDAHPLLSLEVLNWRRKAYYMAPMCAAEYARGIKVAGTLKNIDLAIELFTEARNRELRTVSVYNALMAAYLHNGSSDKCLSLFDELKRTGACTPTIETYNIVISMYGRVLKIDQMEATLWEIRNLNLSPNVKTYKNLISGYLTAWKWDSMEMTYLKMKASGVKPDLSIHLLMLRGYAFSGQLDKMEQFYELVKAHVNQNGIPLIRAMILAYCRSYDVHRIKKIEKLLKLIPENQYKPWLNVELIRFYAKLEMLEEMEDSIKEAFEHKTCVTTVGVMRCIITNYYRRRAVDRLADFVRQAESAGWQICRSLYHCMMVLYSAERRLTEMERVLHEMDRMNLDCTRRTLWILYKAYSEWGQKTKLAQVEGMLWKHGCTISAHNRE